MLCCSLLHANYHQQGWTCYLWTLVCSGTLSLCVCLCASMCVCVFVCVWEPGLCWTSFALLCVRVCMCESHWSRTHTYCAVHSGPLRLREWWEQWMGLSKKRLQLSMRLKDIRIAPAVNFTFNWAMLLQKFPITGWNQLLCLDLLVSSPYFQRLESRYFTVSNILENRSM